MTGTLIDAKLTASKLHLCSTDGEKLLHHSIGTSHMNLRSMAMLEER